MRAPAAGLILVAACKLHFDPAEFDSCQRLDAAATRTFRWSENEHCYSFHIGGVGFGLARSACESLGAHLATLGATDEHDAVLRELAPDRPTWIGYLGNNVGWVTGEPLPFAAWQAGYPAFGNGVQQVDGSWTTSDPGSALGFLCESSVVVTATRVYELETDLQTFDAAAQSCTDRGGHLLTINSPEEHLITQPLFGSGLVGERWIGLTDAASEGRFEWITGEALTFTNFDLSVPEPNGGTNENCVDATLGAWRDLPCTSQRAYVCELQ